MATFNGDCNMFGTGSISGLGFGAQTIGSATYSGIGSNQLTINLQGTYTSFKVVRTNITGGNIITTFTGQTGSTFKDNALSANTQYSYSLIPNSNDNDGPTFPLPSVWTLANVTYNTFSNTFNSVQINWAGVYSSISVTRTSPTAGTPTGPSSNYPTSSSPQTSVTGYLTDTGLSYNTFIYTIIATNGGGVSTTITTRYTTSIPTLPGPTFGNASTVSSSSYGTYNYWIFTGNNTITFPITTNVGYVLVGGGGAGGDYSIYYSGSGGGGGGGVCWATKESTTSTFFGGTTYSISVGLGATSRGGAGSDTTITGSNIVLTAKGGNGGVVGFKTYTGGLGGSGGSGGTSSGGKNNITGGSGTQGTSGLTGGSGPIIRLLDIGKTYQFSGGGGGGSGYAKKGGNGGAGGGGNGINSSAYKSSAAATYYGGGGGGLAFNAVNNNGYDGFVLIYY
jgi:hypothetical protein